MASGSSLKGAALQTDWKNNKILCDDAYIIYCHLSFLLLFSRWLYSFKAQIKTFGYSMHIIISDVRVLPLQLRSMGYNNAGNLNPWGHGFKHQLNNVCLSCCSFMIKFNYGTTFCQCNSTAWTSNLPYSMRGFGY